MSKLFHACISNGPCSCEELDLPASDYELLDMAERLRLEPGRKAELEILRYPDSFSYLEKCIHELPDIFQLNALAKKLAELTSPQDMAAFEGLTGQEIRQNGLPIPLSRLIGFAGNTEGCALAENVMTDFQLGKFLVENGFLPETEEMSDAAIALLDFGKIGKEHREAEGGLFTAFGYVEQLPEVQNISETTDFQPKRPPYTVLLNVAKLPIQERDMLQLRLPAPEEQLQEALDKLGAESWVEVAVSILDCPIPRLNHTLYLDGEAPQILELAQCLQHLDERGELTKYKAVLEVSNCMDLSKMVSLAGALDDYFFEPQTGSPEAVAREELSVIVNSQDVETLLPYVDLVRYGRALLERDQAVITEYGLLQREQTIEQPRLGGMEMN